MNDSSFGSAAPKNRSINVGANLLGEWIAEQASLRKETARYGALLGACLVVAGVALPVLWRAATAASREAVGLRVEVSRLDAQLVISDRTRKAAQPTLVVAAMSDRTGAAFDRFLAQIDRVLSAGNSRTALASLHCDVQGGEAHIVVQADAEEDGAADAFVRNAGEEGSKVDAITSSRPSPLLAPQGLAFQYEKRIGVAK